MWLETDFSFISVHGDADDVTKFQPFMISFACLFTGYVYFTITKRVLCVFPNKLVQ